MRSNKSKLPAKNSPSVKQTFYTSITMDMRLQKFCKDKGVKASDIFKINLENFLTNNNY